MQKRNPRKGLLFAFSGMVLLSMNFVTAKYSLRGFRPEAFVIVWLVAASFYSFVYVVLTGRARQLWVFGRKLGLLLILGMTNGITQIVTWEALWRLDPSFMAFLGRLMPVFAILFGVMFFSERLKSKEILPIVIIIAGGAISAIGGWSVVGTGVLLAVAAYFFTAVQFAIGKKGSFHIHPSVLAFYRLFIGLILVSAWVFVRREPSFDVAPRYWIVALGGASLGPFLGYVCMYTSYNYWELARSTVVMTVQPLIVLPLAFLFLGMLPTVQQLCGGIVITLGALWLVWVHRPSQNPT